MRPFDRPTAPRQHGGNLNRGMLSPALNRWRNAERSGIVVEFILSTPNTFLKGENMRGARRVCGALLRGRLYARGAP